MSEAVEDLEKLAEICLANAKLIKQHLASNNLSQPTFHQNGPSAFPAMSAEAELARLQLQDASKRLFDLASGPVYPLFEHIYGVIHDVNAFKYVYTFQIANAVPFGRAISYKALADKTGTNERQLKKVMRHLATINVFCEPQQDHVSHTASSKLLTLDQGPVKNIWYQCIENSPITSRLTDAIKKWGHGAEDLNQTPVQLHYKSDKPMFAIYEEQPHVIREFSDLMRFVSQSPGLSTRHAVNGYDWAALGDATVVDIGGSVGHCSLEFARASPQAKFVVQDLPNVVARANDHATSAIPPEFRGRVSFMAHNFFEPQPVAADVYFLRLVLHNYSDKIAIGILSNITRAMRPGSRLVIMDQITPSFGELPWTLERFMRSQDMQMMTLLNATQREMNDWKALFWQVDRRLQITKINKPPGSILSILEVMLNDSPVDATREKPTLKARL